MTARRQYTPLLTLLASAVFVVSPAVAFASEPPVKEIVTGHFGLEVDKTTKGKLCTVESGNECQPGTSSGQPGGFDNPYGVAGAVLPSSDDVYVVDETNHRVQELEADGKFVLMFGKDVNKKGGDLCTQAEESQCQAGVIGTDPGELGRPRGIAVDPVSGDVYIAEIVEGIVAGSRGFANRVQEFTPTGGWVLELGREVNETKDREAKATPAEKDVCTAEEVQNNSVKCTVPALSGTYRGFTEPGAFGFGEETGGFLAVGGPEHLLYVGDEHRVQEFETQGATDGAYKGEIPLTSLSAEPATGVTTMAVDKAGDVYLVYPTSEEKSAGVIHEFDPAGKEVKSFQLAGEKVFVNALAFDSAGRLLVSESVPVAGQPTSRGSLYEVGGVGLRLITEFASQGSESLAFNGAGELYAAIAYSVNPANKQEVIAYKPVAVGELLTSPVACKPGPVSETDATLDCDLNGEVNPEEVAGTETWFQWGRTFLLGSETPVQPVATGKTPVGVSAPVAGLRPGETFYYQLAGHDSVVKAPELLTSAQASFTTPTVPPRILGEPGVSFVHAASAVMFGELNPENTNTRYEFQYAPAQTCHSLEEACPGLAETAAEESAAYQEIPTTLEATGLQPATTYRYRLFAVNQPGGPGEEAAVGETGVLPLPEGTFTTAPAPVPQALTGAASQIGTTSAIVSGMTDADGEPASYAFELGVEAGAATQYGILFTGSAGAESTYVEKAFALSGLQPGTTYSYRIKVSSGYGTAYGQPVSFTTAGLPAVLPTPTPLPQLAVPNIAFPVEAQPVVVKRTTKCAKGKKLSRGTCVKVNAKKKQVKKKRRK